MKWINFLFNPSKRIKHVVNKKKEEDVFYILKKQLVKLKLQATTHVKTTSYFSVFSRLFLLLGLTLVIGFGVYFKMVNISSPLEQIAQFIYHLKIPIFSEGFNPLHCYGTRNAGALLLLGPMFLCWFGGIFWFIGFSRHLFVLPLATFILAIIIGILLGSQFFFYDKYFPSNYIYLLYLLFWIPFLTTVFVLSAGSLLYYFKKICLSEKKANLVITLFFSSYFIVVFFLYRFIVGVNDHWIAIVISLVLAILDIILSTLMWIVTLQQLDQFIEQKKPHKYQWLLISILFLAVMRIFVATLYIVVVIVKMMKIIKNN